MSLKKRIAKLYIWLLPILSVPVLFFVKNNFDREIFIATVCAHILLVVISLAILAKPDQSSDHRNERYFNLAAILLIVGAALTFIAATTFSGTALSSVSGHMFEHYWTSIGFLVATIVSLAGASLLLLSFRDKLALPLLSFILLLIGTIIWIIHLAFRLTVMVWVAENSPDNSVLSTYTMINSWSVSFYGSYMVLSYLAFAGFSAALIKSGMLRGWLITCSAIFGVIAPFLFASGVFLFGMPITVQLVPFLLGVKILLYRNSFKNLPLQEG